MILRYQSFLSAKIHLLTEVKAKENILYQKFDLKDSRVSISLQISEYVLWLLAQLNYPTLLINTPRL